MSKQLGKIFEVHKIPPGLIRSGFFVQKSLDDKATRKSLDKTLVVLKLPGGIRDVGDVPAIHKKTFQRYAPYPFLAQIVRLIKKDPFWWEDNGDEEL